MRFMRVEDVINTGLFSSKSAVTRAHKRGELPAPMRFGNKLVWETAAFEEFIREKAQAAASPRRVVVRRKPR